MDIAATKIELMRLLLQTEKESVLAKLKVVLEEENDWAEHLTPQEKVDLEGIRQADREEFVDEKDIDAEETVTENKPTANDKVLDKGMQYLISRSKSLAFLEDEEELYTDEDMIEKYHEKR